MFYRDLVALLLGISIAAAVLFALDLPTWSAFPIGALVGYLFAIFMPPAKPDDNEGAP